MGEGEGVTRRTGALLLHQMVELKKYLHTSVLHTCDELKRSFREIFLSFQGGF